MAGGTGQKFQVATTITAGTFALVSTLLSIVSIWFQLKNYRKPLLQRYVVRILLMVPIYAISSWVSMISLTAASFLDPIRDIYEAFTIYTFFQLLINYLDGERALIIMTHGRAPVHHLWPLNHVLSKVDISDPHTFLAIKRGILQYAWLKPILALAAIIMKATGTYQEGYIGLNSGYLWSGIIYNISVTVSLYALGLFWVCMHNDLTPFRPVPKFLCIKLIIFASYWQGFFLSILVWLGAIPDDVEGYTSDNLAAAIQDALICCEMPFFAAAHWYAFSWHDYANNTVSSARLPVKFALRDAFGIVDLIVDSKDTFRGDHYSYRVFDSTGKVIAHEDSSSRFARMKEGMRYSRGGEAKYWLPKPGEVRGEMNANTPLLNSNGGPSGSSDPPRPQYGEGALEETTLDKFDERLYDKARELEFGDFNYPAITANIPSREIWRTPAPAAYQASSGAWQVGRTPSSTSVTNRREVANSPPTAEAIAPKKSRRKGKQREELAAASKPKKHHKHAPEPAALAAQHEQADGPLGAPHIVTSEPQILEEEAEVEEDIQLEEEEAAREAAEEAARQRAESNEEQGIWDEPVSPPVQSPAYESGNDEAFKNVWGGGGGDK
ncbi:organic solute transporter Ostalpha-domain-containing protein [Microdochium trichocladiopsis]|uniref:Organic solute transporter Ostalpha-domain-containing protein n=1 Tax=Microdochium trichocladiopsis TaxID=1682393 RepID=A0A9P8Y9G7_9PEZI|nr:organic solute transporter Ostalpha-domain-containing protein [Microdochium trichocladiopsis]KAH7031140.1 organic solute transporter Ostalpha-domain-containing protein [Microdochium trichocladiopsis]